MARTALRPISVLGEILSFQLKALLCMFSDLRAAQAEEQSPNRRESRTRSSGGHSEEITLLGRPYFHSFAAAGRSKRQHPCPLFSELCAQVQQHGHCV
jgi:hypothetical protein